jgi:hypothetical protein
LGLSSGPSMQPFDLKHYLSSNFALYIVKIRRTSPNVS